MSEFISGEKIYLRPVIDLDAKKCIEWLNDQETTKYMEHGVYPQKLEDELKYIRNASCMLAIMSREYDEHVGNIELKVERHTAAISIIIGASRGKGYGTEAVKLLVDHVFNRIDIRCITAGMNMLNQACITIFKKNGFKEFGYGKCFYGGEEWLLLKYKLKRKDWKKHD